MSQAGDFEGGTIVVKKSENATGIRGHKPGAFGLRLFEFTGNRLLHQQTIFHWGRI